MIKYFVLFALLAITNLLEAQEFSSYQKPIEISIFSKALNDSVNLEITLPKELDSHANTEYPIIYLLDKQLQNNYTYNLHSIDYLSTLQWMPKSIIIGITFSHKNRNTWTVPNESGGKADDLIAFMQKELRSELKKKYSFADFNLLIGHSRTAIFSSYALSKNPEFFNGIIASSVSYFDFGDKLQQKQFDVFLNKIPSYKHKFYYYFSVGEEAYGDLHQSAVDTLFSYLESKTLPENFEWKYYKYQVAHQLTPGVTVSTALSTIFKDYGSRINACFDIAKKSNKEIPWGDFQNLYTSLSSELGFVIQPSEIFYNSIASDYYNDYEGIYGENHLNFALEILLKAIEKYPNDFSYYYWIGEIYMTQEDTDKGKQYLNKAVELIQRDSSISEIDRQLYLEEIESILK